MPSQHIKSITISKFKDVLSRYTPAVPEKLHDLDVLRYDTIPATVAKRQDHPHLTKDEVEKLVEWKLKHGTFRPKLLQLVQSNSVETIEDTAALAFKELPKSLPALKTLTTLKGIGPATASLLLSVASPDTIPFFSDEVFRWCMWDETGSPSGWQRKIKYNVKEYEILVSKVEEVRKRLGVRALDVERVAWVLGREGVNVDEEYDDGGEDGETENTEVKQAEEKTTTKKGTKRKAGDSKASIEGTRKSTRTKR